MPRDKAFVLLRNPAAWGDDANWVHVASKYRLVQDRGVAPAIPSLQPTIDGNEILNAELLSSKLAASRYASIIESATDGGLEVPTGFEDTDTDKEIAQAAEDLGHAYGLENYCGGNVDYLPAGSDVKFDPANRPNANLPAFLDFVQRGAGGNLGLYGALATGKVESSYSGFRGELVLSWQNITELQQELEDNFSDWAARHAIKWAIAHGILPPPADDAWADYIAWTYPQMPQIDAKAEADGISELIKCGLSTFRDELGPHWKEQLQELAEELDFARSLNLPLAAFESTAGAIVPDKNKE